MSGSRRSDGIAKLLSGQGDHVSHHECINTSDFRWDFGGVKFNTKNLVSYYDAPPKPVELVMWSENVFHYFLDGPKVVNQMQASGLFKGKDSKDVVLLVQDFDESKCRLINRGRGDSTYYRTRNPMEQLLRMQSVMTPHSIVILVDWSKQVESACSSIKPYYWEDKGRSPAYYAVRLEGNFLSYMPQGLHYHCVGVSLGSTGCAALSRHNQRVRGVKFDRIVALDPPVSSFEGQYTDHGKMGLMTLMAQSGEWIPNSDADRILQSHDADYVVTIASSMGSYGYSSIYGADEYIRTNLFGQSHEACETRSWWVGDICARSYYGKYHCEHINFPFEFMRTDGMCYHIMAIMTYMKALDTSQALQGLSVESHRPTSWNAYVTGLDYSHSELYHHLDIIDQHTLARENDMGSAYLMLVVSRKSSVELWTNDRYFGYGEGLPDGYVGRWYFLTYLPSNPVILYGRGGATLEYIRLYKGVSVLSNNFTKSPSGVFPMTAHEVSEYTCYNTYRYAITGTIKYDCHMVEQQFSVPRWRSHMRLFGLNQTTVPRPCGCLKFHRIYKDYVTVKGPWLVGKEGEHISLAGVVGGRVDLQAVLTHSGSGKRIVLATGWDACNVTRGKLRIQMNRFTKDIKVSATSEGYFKAELWLVYEMVVVKVNVTWLSADVMVRKARSVMTLSTGSTGPTASSEHTDFGIYAGDVKDALPAELGGEWRDLLTDCMQDDLVKTTLIVGSVLMGLCIVCLVLYLIYECYCRGFVRRSNPYETLYVYENSDKKI